MTSAVVVSIVNPRAGVMAVSLTPSTRTMRQPQVARPTTIPACMQTAVWQQCIVGQACCQQLLRLLGYCCKSTVRQSAQWCASGKSGVLLMVLL